ncbi:MAG: universal stress protein [Nitritalea sp.]
MFKKIALAVAFSPRMEALIAEAKRLKTLFQSELLLIHVGEHSAALEEKLQNVCTRYQIDPARTQIVWEKGKPVKKILEVCERQGVDLLITGALKSEGFFTYYTGSVARKIIRRAKCAVLTLIEPSTEPQHFSRIVINGTQQAQTPAVIASGLQLARLEPDPRIFIVNEIKMYGFQMATAAEGGEQEASQMRKKLVAEEIKYVQDILDGIDCQQQRITIKVTSGKWAVELAKFATESQANLLVLGDEGNLGFIDRLFPHDLEDMLSNLPCNLLILKP